MEAAPERRGVTGPNAWSPTVGLDVLPTEPRAAFASGRWNRMPVIAGFNEEEGRLFSYLRGLRGDLLTDASYEAEVRRLFGERGEAILSAYPASAFDSARAAYAAVLTDGLFACPALDLDHLIGRSGPGYIYAFADPDPPFALPRLPFSGGAGGYHTAEIAYVFDRPWLLADPARFDPAQASLSATMQDFWGSFAASGRPEGAAPWPRFEVEGDVLRLAPVGVALTGDEAERHRCAFWDALARRGASASRSTQTE